MAMHAAYIAPEPRSTANQHINGKHCYRNSCSWAHDKREGKRETDILDQRNPPPRREQKKHCDDEHQDQWSVLPKRACSGGPHRRTKSKYQRRRQRNAHVVEANKNDEEKESCCERAIERSDCLLGPVGHRRTDVSFKRGISPH